MKIDLVYLWVDGTDPVWITKKNKFLAPDKQVNPETAGDCRYVEHHELKYSLRSVEMYAPWINHIYIVTDNQHPEWLDTNHPKITIINHEDIIPAEYLPLFNSAAIESFLHNINGLSEHFLYANDDMMFGRPVEPSHFFHSDGEPKVRLVKMKIKGKNDYYRRSVYRTQQKTLNRYGKYFKLAPHHNIDAYRRSDIDRAIREFGADYDACRKNRFRNDSNLQRALILYILLANSDKKFIKIGRYNGANGLRDILKRFFKKRYITDSRCFPIGTKDLEEKIDRYNPALFTLNDESRATEKDHSEAKMLLRKLFPNKSSFEIQTSK